MFWIVCVLMGLAVVLIVYWPILQIEYRFRRQLKSRPLLDDQQFYEHFYADTTIAPQVPVRLRRLFARELGKAWLHLHPQDNVVEAEPELDLADLVCNVQRTFGVQIPIQEIRSMDGTFDSLVRCLDGKLKRS